MVPWYHARMPPDLEVAGRGRLGRCVCLAGVLCCVLSVMALPRFGASSPWAVGTKSRGSHGVSLSWPSLRWLVVVEFFLPRTRTGYRKYEFDQLSIAGAWKAIVVHAGA